MFLSPGEYGVLAAAVDHLIPPDGDHPGAAALGAVDYIDGLLGAFSYDPPRIWTGGPFSGRYGGEPRFGQFHALTPLEELAWRTRIEGSRGIAEREWNGPIVGWQEVYRAGVDALGPDFETLDANEQRARLDAAPPAFRDLLYTHACEGCYGAPEYSGNCDRRGWAVIGWPGDTQPRGWTDAEVSGRE